MTRVEQKLKLTDEKFKRRIGTTQPVFLLMLDILQAARLVEESPGSVHDFTLCKETLLFVMVLAVIIFANSGYQGIQEYHEWSLIPVKKSKKKELSDSEKAFNRELSRCRIVIENINAQIKVFKIMSYLYRNRRRRHMLRTKLICTILNAEKA